MKGKHWTEYIKDNDLIRNIILVTLFAFVLIGLIVLYIKGDLEFNHFLTSIDIAIGIIIGTGLLKLLRGNKNVERR